MQMLNLNMFGTGFTCLFFADGTLAQKSENAICIQPTYLNLSSVALSTKSLPHGKTLLLQLLCGSIPNATRLGVKLSSIDLGLFIIHAKHISGIDPCLAVVSGHIDIPCQLQVGFCQAWYCVVTRFSLFLSSFWCTHLGSWPLFDSWLGRCLLLLWLTFATPCTLCISSGVFALSFWTSRH